MGGLPASERPHHRPPRGRPSTGGRVRGRNVAGCAPLNGGLSLFPQAGDRNVGLTVFLGPEGVDGCESILVSIGRSLIMGFCRHQMGSGSLGNTKNGWGNLGGRLLSGRMGLTGGRSQLPPNPVSPPSLSTPSHLLPDRIRVIPPFSTLRIPPFRLAGCLSGPPRNPPYARGKAHQSN